MQRLAHSFFFLANEGKTKAGIPILESQVKRLNALMQTCGFMMIRNSPVGLPGKRNGGGIAALFQNFVVATWSPRLNEKEIQVRDACIRSMNKTECQFSKNTGIKVLILALIKPISFERNEQR
jgi:glutaminase